MALKKLNAPSLTDLFVKELERMILSNELKPGEKLMPERQLAAEMGVSTAVVNAGIVRLDYAGFLRIVPRKGIYIADYIANGNLNTMKEMVEFSGNHLDHEVQEAISEMRRNVEIASMKHACNSRSDESLVSLKAILDDCFDETKKNEFPENAFRFTHAIAQSASNKYYAMIIQTFKPMYLLLYKVYLQKTEQKDLAEPLARLYAAVEKKDEKAGVKAVNVIIDRWQKSFDYME